MESQVCSGLTGESGQPLTKSWVGRRGPELRLSGGGGQGPAQLPRVTSLEVGHPGALSPLSKAKGMIAKGSVRNSVASPFLMMVKIRARVPFAWDSLGLRSSVRGL